MTGLRYGGLLSAKAAVNGTLINSIGQSYRRNRHNVAGPRASICLCSRQALDRFSRYAAIKAKRKRCQARVKAKIRKRKLEIMPKNNAAERHVQPRRPLKVQPEVPAFRAIGIQAVAAAAPLQRRAAPRHQTVVSELPPLLRKDKFID
jgi:hypothetical protein